MEFVEEIKLDEMLQINGGSEFSNWTWRQLGKGLGYLVNATEQFFDSQSSGVDNIGGPTANHG
ncbi:hypothetical protein HCX49_12840 [Sphingobacterium kitahiroshimense]|uniref:hypothetical protein n=1 Tax=Sphingobacterium sp. B16(2022) TaxID=2914044 RepID=UPI00143BF922|nr:hypothetical protein [Sphingobacterium sp. B16(2022)]NJI74089.1 hypothetical protein [Sphingobacterium sp. B16(2022)]